jgi:inorganic triphosphatase YgiF
MTDPVPVEMEAKLLVPRAADLSAISRLTRIGELPLRSRGQARLHSIYLDTPALTLARHGMALRLRRHGRRWEATLKWSGAVRGDVHERFELSVALPKPPALPLPEPPAAMRGRLAALVAGRPLIPILVSDIRRRLMDVLPPAASASAAPVAELALDVIRLRDPLERHPDAAYCEVEIERRHGSRRDIARLARRLRRDFKLERSTESKFSRGVSLFHGASIIGSADQRVLGGDTVRQGMRHIVACQLCRIRRHDPGARLGEDPEELHDMRVATRRLREALRLFPAGIPARWRDPLARELRWLGRRLGAVRDLDVHLAMLNDFTAAAPAGFRPALGCLREHMASVRRRDRATMLASLDAPRYFGLLRRLERAALARGRRPSGAEPPPEPMVVAAERAIRKAFRRLMDRGQTIRATPCPEDLHALRIRAKRLRYLLEFFRELTGKPGRRLVKRLVALQDLLGGYHDAVVWADVVRGYIQRAGARLRHEQVVALGALVACELRHADEMRAGFDKAWRRFTRARTAADVRALRKMLRGRRPSPPGKGGAAAG